MEYFTSVITEEPAYKKFEVNADEYFQVVHQRILENYQRKRNQEKEKYLEKQLSDDIEKKLEKCLDKALNDLLKGFK